MKTFRFILEIIVILVFDLIKLVKDNKKDDLNREGLSGDVRKF